VTGLPAPVVAHMTPRLTPQQEAFLQALALRARATSRPAPGEGGWLAAYGVRRCPACGSPVYSRCKGCGAGR
jgi:hypothetical protein